MRRIFESDYPNRALALGNASVHVSEAQTVLNKVGWERKV